METEHHVDLTSSEIANIWMVYQESTMSICVIKYFLANIQDTEIQNILELGLHYSQTRAQQITAMFSNEQLPVPDGFSEENDLHLQAPRLFTDIMYLIYMQNRAKIALETFTLALTESTRSDQRQFFSNCINQAVELFNKATELMLSKGILSRPPHIPKSKQIEYVQKQSFLTGWFGERRPLNVIEMSNVFSNLIQNIIGKEIITGFSQVAKSQDVRNYMVRGKQIAAKQVEIFGSTLSKDNLSPASKWGIEATDSIVAPFSDKLMMFHITAMIGIAIGDFGTSFGRSLRHDLGALYTRLMAEIAQYAEDGVNIMIENGWLEQPPQAPERDQLANKK